MGFEQLAELKKQLSKQATQDAAANRRRPDVAGRPAGTQAKRDQHDPRGKGDQKRAQEGDPKRTQKREQEPVDPVVHAIGKLQKRFPAAFPKKPAPKVPLKVGILEDLLPHAEQLALSAAEIREAIGTWCRGTRYWACLVEGAARVDLAGAAAGQVTKRDTAFARSVQRGAPRRPRGVEGSSVPAKVEGQAESVEALAQEPVPSETESH